MSVISRIRRQDALYWRAAPGTSRDGRVSHFPPIPVKCRWEEGADEIALQNGSIVAITGTVYADQKMYLGDLLFLGKSNPFHPSEAPSATKSVREVVSTKSTPNFKNTETLFMVYVR